VHLAQSSAAAGQFGTQLLFVRAEQALHAGIVDRSAYEEVLTREPNHAGAQAALDRISGREAERQRERKRQVAAVAGMLLLAAALLFGRYRLRGATAEASA